MIGYLKVVAGEGRDEQIVGNYGMGRRNEREEYFRVLQKRKK